MDPCFFREYAIAKKCITEKSKANCQICDHIRRDAYNPFCPNKTDPLLQVNGMKLKVILLFLCVGQPVFTLIYLFEVTFFSLFFRLPVRIHHRHFPPLKSDLASWSFSTAGHLSPVGFQTSSIWIS